jgi:hypothetical protein
MTDITIKVEQTFTQERIEDLLCCAFEGGIGYWAQIKTAKTVKDADYAHQFPTRGGSVTLSDSTGEGWPEVRTEQLDFLALTAGLQTMADKYPKHLADFTQDNEDAETGDVFVQCAIFGDVIFG